MASLFKKCCKSKKKTASSNQVLAEELRKADLEKARRKIAVV